MQGYNPDFQAHHHAVAQSSGSLHDRTSPSGSDDDAGYPHYPEPHRMETGLDDDPNAALTSQTLNTDGTPKRPMNAFMIFARRRRPQVAAENQSMRTGEVSKILSREWNSMNMSDKQFYLDQAKQLKDAFNQKYPDYVYKRRPNNSRRRRKPDPSPGLAAESGYDLVDDYSASTEYGDVATDVSPVDLADVDDHRPSGQDVRYASMPADAPGGAYSTAPPRASGYQTSEVPYRSLGDTRGAYTPRPDRTTPDAGVTSSISSAPRGSEHGAGYYYPFLQQHHHHAQPSPYFPESSSNPNVWSSTRDDPGRMQVQSWPQSGQDLGGDDRHRGYHQALSSHGWANTGGSEGVSSSGASGASTAGFGLSTLNSPFFPSQSSSTQEGFSSSSVQPVSVSSQHYGVAPPIQRNPVSGRSYPTLQQPYSSASSSALGSYQPQGRTGSLIHSPGPPVPSFPHAQSTRTPPPAGSGAESSQTGYWSRER